MWVGQVSILPDEVAAISGELRALSEAHDVVITSGGLGPTIDDVTMQAVADALDHQLTRCAQGRSHCSECFPCKDAEHPRLCEDGHGFQCECSCHITHVLMMQRSRSGAQAAHVLWKQCDALAPENGRCPIR